MADLKRRLFGYSSASVRLLLTERDAALDRASRSASAAEQRAERLSSELSEAQGRLVGFEEEDAAPGQPDPGGVGARTSHEPHIEEAPGPAAEWIVPPAPPQVDQAHPLGAERHSG